MSSPSSASGQPPSIQELRAARGARPSFARRFRRWLIAAGVVAFLILFGFFGLPPIVKAQAVKQLSTRLGRAVVIEKVRINPLVLSTTIEGFAIAEADPAEGEFTGWRRLYVNFDTWSLLRGKVGFQEIALDGFRVRVAKEKDGGLNFDDIVAKLTAKDPAAPAPEPKDPDSKPLALVIGKLAVTDAQVSFADSSLERPYSTVAGPLTFTLHDFETVGDPDSPYQFEALTAADRPYKPAKTLSEALQIMRRMAEDGHLDPALYQLFLDSGVWRHYAERHLAAAQADVADSYAYRPRQSLHQH